MDKTRGSLILFVASCVLLKSGAEDVRNCFDVQVERPLSNVSASPDRLRALGDVRRAVEETLDTVWPDSSVKLFGSLSTGLGSPTSDLDISVSLPRGVYLDRDVIDTARAAFQAFPHIYQQIHTRSRLPAITLYFVPADIICDIHFRVEPLEVEESSLLHFLLHIDERALKLAIIVKHWAKIHKLICRKYLTSYGMMMLVIFYLQQCSILPSVVQLQKYVPTETNGTNCINIVFQKQNIVSNNNESSYEILGGFFEYYETFDFDNFIVSPYIGQVVEKSLFRDLETVPDDFLLYKRNVANDSMKPFNITAVCIQSLLINDNCAWRVDTTNRFKESFRNAAKSYRENEECSFLRGIGV